MNTETRHIFKELHTAADWWSQLFFPKDFTKKNLFNSALLHGLFEGMKLHWYPSMPERGQGYRSLDFEKLTRRIDGRIVEAAQSVGIDLFEGLDEVVLDEVVMWVDPGSVVVKKAQIIGYHTDETEEVLYSGDQSWGYGKPVNGFQSGRHGPSLKFEDFSSNFQTSPPKKNFNFGYDRSTEQYQPTYSTTRGGMKTRERTGFAF